MPPVFKAAHSKRTDTIDETRLKMAKNLRTLLQHEFTIGGGGAVPNFKVKAAVLGNLQRYSFLRCVSEQIRGLGGQILALLQAGDNDAAFDNVAGDLKEKFIDIVEACGARDEEGEMINPMEDEHMSRNPGRYAAQAIIGNLKQLQEIAKSEAQRLEQAQREERERQAPPLPHVQREKRIAYFKRAYDKTCTRLQNSVFFVLFLFVLCLAGVHILVPTGQYLGTSQLQIDGRSNLQTFIRETKTRNFRGQNPNVPYFASEMRGIVPTRTNNRGLWATCDERAMVDLFFTAMLDEIAGVPICNDGEKCEFISKLECIGGEYKVSDISDPSSRSSIRSLVAKSERLEPYFNYGMDSLISIRNATVAACLFTAFASIPLAWYVLKRCIARGENDLWDGQVARQGPQLMMVGGGELVPARPRRPSHSPARRRGGR